MELRSVEEAYGEEGENTRKMEIQLKEGEKQKEEIEKEEGEKEEEKLLEWTIRDIPSPQCQPNQPYCTAGEALLILCAGLWARAQACHPNFELRF